MTKYFTFILLLAVSVHLNAQRDSLLLNGTIEDVIIIDQSPSTLNRKTYSLANHLGQLGMDLSAWMDARGLAQINRYGAAGSVASMRFRGMSSDHSQVLWYNVPINSISLGMCDMSLVPTFLFDKLELNTEPTANEYAPANLGACIQLGNNMADSTFSSAFYTSVNSLYNSTLGVGIGYALPINTRSASNGRKTIFFKTKALIQNYQNQFTYTDKYQISKPEVLQTHNDGQTIALTEDAQFGWRKSTLGAHLWYQTKQMMLPNIMGSLGGADALQDDDFVRFNLNINTTGATKKLSLTAAVNQEKLYWRSDLQPNNDWLFQSNTEALNVYALANLEQKFGNKFLLKTSANGTVNKVTNTNYANDKQYLNQILIGGSLVYKHETGMAEIAYKQEFRNTQTAPTYSLFYAANLTNNTAKLTAKYEGMVARRFRLPDMNELYWQPGGNTLLLAEKGWNTNNSILIKHLGNKLEWNTKINLYSNYITNWIQWRPTEFGYWSPKNYKQVISNGAELEIKCTAAIQNSRLAMVHRTSYNEALGTNVTGSWSSKDMFRMTYSPRVVVYNEAKWITAKSHYFISHKYTSLRYTDEENTQRNALAPYHLLNVGAEYQWQKNQSQWKLGITIDNIFNTAYESVRGYAMPGRIFQLHMQIQLKQNKQTK